MRRGIGGEGVGKGTTTGRKVAGLRIMKERRRPMRRAKYLQQSRNLPRPASPKHIPTTRRVVSPPALRMTSCISSRGGSQESITSATGPERYQPNHSMIRVLKSRRFTPIIVAPLRRLNKLQRQISQITRRLTLGTEVYRQGAQSALDRRLYSWNSRL